MRRVVFTLIGVLGLLGPPLAESTGGRTKGNASREYLLEKIKSSTPSHTTDDIDCMWRHLAAKYADTLQPLMNETKRRLLHDALELASKCGETYRERYATVALPDEHDAKVAASVRTLRTARFPVFYVDPETGSDDNEGTIESTPLRTFRVALERSREVGAPTRAIVLRGGTHRLNETITLKSEDSGLKISSYPGERAVVSGGRLLNNLAWTLEDEKRDIYKAKVTTGLSPEHEMLALHYRGQRVTLARYPNANPELDLFPLGYITSDTAWSAPRDSDGNVCDPNLQCGRSENITVPASDAWHGMYQNYSVGRGGACDRYSPNFSPWCSGEFYLLRQFPEMHTRSPSGIENANAALPNAPYATASDFYVHAWRPGHWYTWMFRVNETTPSTRVSTWTVYEGTNAVYGQVPAPKQSTDTIKYLGEFDDQNACWSACNTSATCHGWTYHKPNFDASFAKQCYALMTGEWSAQSEDNVVSGRGPHDAGGAFVFGAGGHQGGEGNEGGGEWFVQGVREELDEANEFHFDRETGELRFIPNTTAFPIASGSDIGDVVVPVLSNLIDVRGTRERPIRNVTIENLTFTATRPTYMDPRTNPSGGDWSLERSGSLYLEDCESVSIRGNTFVRLDSNAISINGYARDVAIESNEFVWLGQNAITSWGRSNFTDATEGTFPRNTRVAKNFVHEIGHIQKQSSFYFQAVTSEAEVSENIVFNIPRAAINFNDGAGGGANVHSNLLFNTCRESSDHGAFNSWDRLPYVTTVRDGRTPSTVPAVNDVHHNFIVSNFAADGGCLDNDDGSSYYDIHDNVCFFGGHKQNFDGHSKRGFRNIYIHPQVYGTKCIDEETEGESTHTSGPHGLPFKGYAEAYFDNICILPNAGDPYFVGGGDLADEKDFNDGMVLGNNTIYAPNENVSLSVSGVVVSFDTFQSKGFDPTSSVSSAVPSADQIATWSRQKLGF